MAPYLAQLPKGARILDGGCGLGDWTLCLARQGFSVAGLDLSRQTVAQLKSRFPEAEFVDGDIRRTVFSDNSFDAYFSWGVFEHFEAGLQDCVREAYRIVKPGGWLFITVPMDNLRLAMLAATNSSIPVPEGRQRFYQWRLTRPELQRELAGATATAPFKRPAKHGAFGEAVAMGECSARATSQVFLAHSGVEPLGPLDLLAEGRTRFPRPMPAIGALEASYMQPQHDGMLQDG